MPLDIRQGDWLSALSGPVNNITTTATARAGAWNHCTGTSADYTVTLPAANTFKDGFIGFRMGSAAALTELVTLDGNGSETIDGATTRVMWAGETAVLKSDGSNLFKVAGKTIPMMCRMRLISSQAGVSSATMTKVLLNWTDLDNTGLMSNGGSGDMTIRRDGNYLLIARLSWDAGSGTGFTAGSTAGVRMRQEVHLTSTAGAQLSASEVTGHVNAAPDYTVQLCSDILWSRAAGDVVIQAGYYNSGSGQGFFGTSGDCTSLALIEQPTW